MKRFSIPAAAVLTLVAFAYGYNEPHPGVVNGQEVIRTQERPISREEIRGRVPRDRAELPKGTAVVEKLPEGVEGVIMEKGVVKIRPGYKAVKKGNKVTVIVTVMRSAVGGAGGRLGVGGSWSCVCKQGTGGCSTMVQDNQIFCAPGGEPACPDKCVLSVVINALKSEIIRY